MTSERPLRVAVVGAGPAGFYAAGALLGADPPAEVDVVDRLPTPWGLVRTGVAPDHPNIKAVSRAFEKIAQRPGFRFLGNVEVGKDVAHSELAELYDAVGEVGMQRYAPLLEHISAIGSVAHRVERLVFVRSKFLEATVPITRALTAQSLVGPAIDQAVRVSRDALRLHCKNIKRLFQKDLEHLPDQDQSDVIEAIGAATSPHLWEYLRRSRGSSMIRARAIVKRSLTSILRDAGVDA